jgi:hypothetical protein
MPVVRRVAAMPAEDADAFAAPRRDDDAPLAAPLIVAPPPAAPRNAGELRVQPATRVLPERDRTLAPQDSAAPAVPEPLPERVSAEVVPVAAMVAVAPTLAPVQPPLPRATVDHNTAPPLPVVADVAARPARVAPVAVGLAPLVVALAPQSAAAPPPALPEAVPAVASPAAPLQPAPPPARVPGRRTAAVEQSLARALAVPVPQPAAVPPASAATGGAAWVLSPVALAPPVAAASPSVTAPPSRRIPPPLPATAFDIAAAAPMTPPPLAAVAAPAPPRAAAPVTPPPLPIETEALGSIAIALDRRDMALHVHFTVDRPSAAQALLESAVQLDGALQSGGTRLDQLSVDVRGGSAQGQSAPSDHGGQRPPPRGARAALPSAASAPPRDARIATQDRFA